MAESRACWLIRFALQSSALLKKHLLIRVRSWRLNLFHCIQSVLVIFLIWAINEAVMYSNSQFSGQAEVRSPPSISIPSIPDCSTDYFLRVRLEGLELT